MKKNAFQASSPNSSIIQNGDLFLIDMRKIIPLPWDQWAEEIIQNGYSIITLTPSIQIDFLEMQKLIGGISYHDRKEFSFVEHSDGFTPVGYSYNNDAANTDLCETFNFWQKNSPQHKNFKFSDDKFYSHSTNYESQISIYGQHFINAILRKYDYRTEISIREDSYLQFNYFKEELRSNGKKYLQHRHEDGHLLTIIKPNSPGLVIYVNDTECLVDVGRDQAIVITGSLLTQLSEGQINPIYHAVINFTLPTPRCSVVYNVNTLHPTLSGMVSGAEVKIFDHANARHQTFGFDPLKRQQTTDKL